MKALQVDRKSLKYLFWLGPVLTIAGLTAGLVAGNWGPIPVGLLIVGIGLIVVWLLTQANALPEFFGRRSTQASTNAVLATIAMLVILGLINFLGVRSAQRIDLTENQLFTLAPQTVELVQTLEQPVKVRVFDLALHPQDQALLENYQRENPLFSFERTDPQAEPGIAREFGVQSFGEVHLEQGTQRRFVQTLTPDERLSENRLTNAIAQLSNPLQPKVYLLQGHGERTLEAGQGGLSQASTKLSNENFLLEPLNLAQATTVPEDADVVIVAGPQRQLLEAEVDALEDYLQTQSGLLLLLDPNTDTGLEPLLQERSIGLGDRVIVDQNNQPLAIVNQYGPHPITEKFANGISIFPVAQPLLMTEQSELQMTPLLITSDSDRAQRLGDDGALLEFDPAIDPQGAMVLGVAMSQPVTNTQSDSQPEANSSPNVTPTSSPTSSPDPTSSPTSSPSPRATASPTTSPTASPTTSPTAGSNSSPSPRATASPTTSPTASPTASPKSNSAPTSPQNKSIAQSSPTPQPSPESNLSPTPSAPESNTSAEDSEAATAPPEARLVIIGNSSFATDGLVNQQLNGDIFLNTVNWLSQRSDQTLSIRPREATNRRIVLTAQQQIWLALLSLAVLPLLGFLSAFVVWWSRR
jgi:ABC-type uncharacterized transport system involved in gliding motility auxiliary subunit